jgi:hypothetical protein
MMWRKEELNGFKCVEGWTEGTRGKFLLVAVRTCTTRPVRARHISIIRGERSCARQVAERDWLDGFLSQYILNLIISFFFFERQNFI